MTNLQPQQGRHLTLGDGSQTIWIAAVVPFDRLALFGLTQVDLLELVAQLVRLPDALFDPIGCPRLSVEDLPSGAGVVDHGVASSSNSPGSYTAHSSRRLATSRLSTSFSIPMKRKPSSLAATPVLPLPMKGSSTTPPGGMTSRQSQRMRSTGFTVGCLLR